MRITLALGERLREHENVRQVILALSFHGNLLHFP
jgi:hypothetical protein